MYKTLRIIFTLLSALCVAVVIPVGALFGFEFSIGTAIGALVFFFGMLYSKQKQEELEGEQNQKEPDFLTPTEPDLSTNNLENQEEK